MLDILQWQFDPIFHLIFNNICTLMRLLVRMVHVDDRKPQKKITLLSTLGFDVCESMVQAQKHAVEFKQMY